MNRERLGLSLLFGLLFFALTAYCEVAQGQVPDAPESLVLRFDASAANLDQVSIRAAITQELAMAPANDGSDQAATLIVSVTESGDVQLSYRPARETLTRSVPITNESNVPQLIAHLAGNLVRDEAGALLAELVPQTEPPVSAPVPQVRHHTIAAWNRDGDADSAPTTATRSPYLNDAWVFSALIGFDISLIQEAPEQAQLTLQQSKRFGRLELALGARIAYGQVHVVAQGGTGGDFDGGAIYGYQVTLPLSAEYRVLGNEEAYLQLGAALGMRTAGVMNRSESITSGSPIYVYAGLQITAGFRLADNQGLVLRAGWDFLPPSHFVSSGDTEYELSPVQHGFNLGWQIGW